MDKNLAQEAVSAALNGNWKKAIEINKDILKNDKNDVDALNRLARAYAEEGHFRKATKSAQKVLDIDPFNSIASKSLKKWKEVKKVDSKKQNKPKKLSTPQSFLEEPGKTKIVPLLHLGDQKTIAQLDSGDEVNLKTHSHRISITTQDNDYIGRLPDDISARLRKLIKYGNQYQAFIKSADEDEIKVFIKETKKAEGLEDIPSFSSEKIDYVSFTPPELVHKKDDRPNPSNEDEENE